MRGGGEKGTRDERPLFEALYVVSVEGGVPEDDTIPPRSSVEAYERANRRSQPRVIWRCVIVVAAAAAAVFVVVVVVVVVVGNRDTAGESTCLKHVQVTVILTLFC